jgi:hypothetical protein
VQGCNLPGIQVWEWVPLLSRATTGAFPLVRVRLPLASAIADEPQSLEPGSAVEVRRAAKLMCQFPVGHAYVAECCIGSAGNVHGTTVDARVVPSACHASSQCSAFRMHSGYSLSMVLSWRPSCHAILMLATVCSDVGCAVTQAWCGGAWVAGRMAPGEFGILRFYPEVPHDDKDGALEVCRRPLGLDLWSLTCHRRDGAIDGAATVPQSFVKAIKA